MSQKLTLRRIRGWPRWTIIPIGLGLAGLAIVLGLVLEPAAGALSPTTVVPTPTMPTIVYSGAQASGCQDCHFSLSSLQASVTDPNTAEIYLIEAESVATLHGRLGCIACHGGDIEALDKEAAHQDLMADMSTQEPEQCLICHQDIPSEIPGDRLQVPHGLIIEGIEQGEPCDVVCSDCHGGVGHGFDPISGEKHCSMTVCLDCHEVRKLDVRMAECDACHLGPHDLTMALTCHDCHTSTEEWQEVDPGSHPVPLPGRHGEVACFSCHRYPNFEELNNACTDCHESGHSEWGDDDCAQCHDPGGTWDMTASTWEGHVDHWDQYKGQHLNVACAGCHFESYDLDPACTSCHTIPESHSEGRAEADCTACHQADQPWSE